MPNTWQQKSLPKVFFLIQIIINTATGFWICKMQRIKDVSFTEFIQANILEQIQDTLWLHKV